MELLVKCSNIQNLRIRICDEVYNKFNERPGCRSNTIPGVNIKRTFKKKHCSDYC